MTSEIESKISRVIDKLENAQTHLDFPPTTNETQEGNYRMHKKLAGVLTQVNANISSFVDQNESCQNLAENSNDISNSFSEQPSELVDQSFHKPNMKRRASIILDLNKIINIGEYKIELGKLLNILDKKLPDNKENIINNDVSKAYTQCTTEENERRKSFISPEKKKEKISESFSNENSKEKSHHHNYKEELNDQIKDKKFDDNLTKKYHKIALLLKEYLNENKLVNELNNKCLKENNNLNDTMNMNYRRKSLFDMTTYLIPSESSIQSFAKPNQLPNFISNFFKQKKGGKRKKRNTYVGGQFCNKLKQLNQQMNNKSTCKKIPQSEKAEIKIKPTRSSITTDSNIKLNIMNNKKDISQITNFDMSNNNDSESIIDNDNSISSGNENNLFNDRLSAVKKRRQSDFFDNVPQQQEEITGFHKMISTIIEEEDNNKNNVNLQNNNENEKNDANNCDNYDEMEDVNKEGVNDIEKAEEEFEDGEEKEEDKNDEEDDDETILNDDCCYNGNISTSLCFDDLIIS